MNLSPPPPSADLAAYCALGETAVRAAGRLAVERFKSPRDVSLKGFRDLVTDVDFASQALITNLVRERFPDHAFLVEEQDATLPASGRVRWIIDPIDGTTNYSRQLTDYAISLAIAVDDVVQVGLIFDAPSGELFRTVRGEGVTANGQILQASDIASPDDALVAHDWSRSNERRQSILRLITPFTRHAKSIRSFGSAALALAWIAAGRLDVYFNLELGPWDWAAGSLMIEEAGGIITDLENQSLNINTPTSCLATNGRLHPAAVAMLAAA